VVRRLLALALLLEGSTRHAAARATGMDRQTLRDWVHRYNEAGPAGLADRKAPGRAAFLSEEQQSQLAEWVRTGPDPEVDGVVRWRCVDLAAKIKTTFGVELAERSVGAVLHRLEFTRLSVRPQHPQQDAEAVEAHKKTSPIWSPAPSRGTPPASRSNSGGRTRRGSDSRAP
jgi:transposase